VLLFTNNPVSGGWSGTSTTASLSGFSDLQNASAPITFRFYGYGFGAYEDKGLGQIPGDNPDVVLTGALIPSTPAPVSLGYQFNGGALELIWPQGVLLQADALTGPWTTNFGAASPLFVSPTEARKFYRIRVQ